jgi:hypothetical protein
LYREGANLFGTDSIGRPGMKMAKVSIGKDEYQRVLEIAERAAKRTNSRVVVAADRLDLTESTNNNKRTSTFGDQEAVTFS